MAKHIVKINTERCKGCLLCVEACPQKVLTVSEDVNAKGSKYVIVSFPERCTGCAMCAVMCPDCCIEVSNES